MSQSIGPETDLSDIKSELAVAIDECEDEEERYHMRKAAQHLVFALESDSE